MNNGRAQTAIEDCFSDLNRIKHLIETVGSTSPMAHYLSNYAIIRACGTVEYCFKTIISDFHDNASPQIVHYIDKTIRKSSKNPSYSNICSLLSDFDDDWNNSFISRLKQEPNYNRIISSMDGINKARNAFAHGTNQIPSFINTYEQYQDAVIVLEILDDVVK